MKSELSKINSTELEEQELYQEILLLIDQSQQQFVLQANSAVTMLFWQVGKRINQFVLENKRADYGKQIVVTLSRQLIDKCGRNFEEKNLRRMVQFSEQLSEMEIVVTLSRQLSWSHILAILPLKNYEAKLFYAQKAATGLWGVRELRHQIDIKTFERMQIANAQLPDTKSEIQNLFKDPYLFDYLGLKNDYLE